MRMVDGPFPAVRETGPGIRSIGSESCEVPVRRHAANGLGLPWRRIRRRMMMRPQAGWPGWICETLSGFWKPRSRLIL